MYAFDLGTVLFKPTKCAVEQFRASKAEAKSYFIAGDDVPVRKMEVSQSIRGPRFVLRTLE